MARMISKWRRRIKKPKIAYVLKMFPRLSETFILNEMLELERQGTEIIIFSLKKPNEGIFHPQLSNLKAPVFYLEDFDTKKWPVWLGNVWPRLVPKKGFDTLLESCSILKNRDITYKCLIAGNGSDADMLYNKRNDLGLEDAVEFAGAKTPDEIIDLMRRAAILCLPCRIAEDGNRDALPTVLLEALACGLPVISTNISGIPEIIDSGENGVLINPDDPVSLADEIERLLNSTQLREQYSKAGLKKAKESFDIKNNVEILKNLFVESIASGLSEGINETKTIDVENEQ